MVSLPKNNLYWNQKQQILKTKTTFIESFTAPRRAGGVSFRRCLVRCGWPYRWNQVAAVRSFTGGVFCVVSAGAAWRNRPCQPQERPRKGEMRPGCISALGAAENPFGLEPQRPRTLPAFLLGCRFSSDIVGKYFLTLSAACAWEVFQQISQGFFQGVFHFRFNVFFQFLFRFPLCLGFFPGF